MPTHLSCVGICGSRLTLFKIFPVFESVMVVEAMFQKGVGQPAGAMLFKVTAVVLRGSPVAGSKV